jgi:hypothetical protein
MSEPDAFGRQLVGNRQRLAPLGRRARIARSGLATISIAAIRDGASGAAVALVDDREQLLCRHFIKVGGPAHIGRRRRPALGAAVASHGAVIVCPRKEGIRGAAAGRCHRRFCRWLPLWWHA